MLAVAVVAFVLALGAIALFGDDLFTGGWSKAYDSKRMLATPA